MKTSAPAPDAGAPAPLRAEVAPLPPDGPQPADVLADASTYVLNFEDNFAQILSDERYVQRARYEPEIPRDARPRHRDMRSEMLFMHLDEERRWIAVRNVLQVDNRKVGDSHTRLEVLLHGSGAERASRTRALLDESARFNLGSIVRNISDATAVLRYLEPEMRSRFGFTLDGAVTVHGQPAWKLSFAEQQLPTVIQHNGANLPSSGWIYVAQKNGTVLGTFLRVGAPDVRVSISVDYSHDDGLDLWVPSRMDEEYVDPRSPGETIACAATYTNFRRFGTAARLLAPDEATRSREAAAPNLPILPTTATVDGEGVATEAVLPPPLLDARQTVGFETTLVVRGLEDVSELVVPAPRRIMQLDGAALKGEPEALAWAPDGKSLYLQMVQRDFRGKVQSSRHYIISLDTNAVSGLDTEPPWAVSYWKWKSAQSSPASPDFGIDIASKKEKEESFNFEGGAAAAGGGISGGGRGPGSSGGGISAAEVANAAMASQTSLVNSLQVRGVLLGKWENAAVIPGLTFGWAPAPSEVIAFGLNTGGPLTLVDNAGRVRVVAGTKAVLLPAWSSDAARLTWLERKKGKRYDLLVADVVNP